MGGLARGRTESTGVEKVQCMLITLLVDGNSSETSACWLCETITLGFC